MAPSAAWRMRSSCLPGENARCIAQSAKAKAIAAGDRPAVARETAARAKWSIGLEWNLRKYFRGGSRLGVRVSRNILGVQTKRG